MQGAPLVIKGLGFDVKAVCAEADLLYYIFDDDNHSFISIL